MYKPEIISRILVKNLKEFGNPVGMPIQQINTWWKGLNLNLNFEKKRFLVTGMMYQLAPYIARITEWLSIFEERWIEDVVKILPDSLTKVFSKVFSIPNRADIQRFNEILVSIYRLLSKSGVEFYYNPELDFYSGILLYDMGQDDAFKRHASKVVEKLEKKVLGK